MTLDAERLLLPALLAFYLRDCLHLLAADEAALERRGAARWSVRFGSRVYTLRGLEPLLLNPFTPHRPAWRLRWSPTDPQGGSPWTGDAPRELLRLRPWAIALALVVFVAVPGALHGRFGLWVLAGAVVAAYALILGTLWAAWRARSVLALDRGAFAGLAAEVLLCPPYAVNLLRKLAWRMAVPGELLATARLRLSPGAVEEVQRACAARVADALELEDEASPRHAALRRSQEQLAPAGEERPA